MRLKLAQHAGERLGLPHFRGEHLAPPCGVKPENVHFPVLGAKLAADVAIVFQVTLVKFALVVFGVVIRVIPFALGVVDAPRHLSLVAGLGDCLEVIPAKRCLRDFEIGIRRVPHVKPLVVLRDDDDVTKPAFLGDAHPL